MINDWGWQWSSEFEENGLVNLPTRWNMLPDRFETGCNILGQLPLVIAYKKSEKPNLKTFEKKKIMLSCWHIFHNIQFAKKPVHE